MAAATWATWNFNLGRKSKMIASSRSMTLMCCNCCCEVCLGIISFSCFLILKTRVKKFQMSTAGSNMSVAQVEPGVTSTPMSSNYIQGPHQQSVDGLLETAYDLNGSFSELAWANARQNGGRAGCAPPGNLGLGKQLPSWPPNGVNQGWGHTYPVQTKHGETLMGYEQLEYDGPDQQYIGASGFVSEAEAAKYLDSQSASMSNASSMWATSPYLRNPTVANVNQDQPYQLFEKFARTNKPRANNTADGRDYDMALDIAEKIVAGDTLTSTFYQMTYDKPPSSSLSTVDSFNQPQNPIEVASYSEAQQGFVVEQPSILEQQDKQRRLFGSSNKRVQNLMVPDQVYGAAQQQKRLAATKSSDSAYAAKNAIITSSGPLSNDVSENQRGAGALLYQNLYRLGASISGFTSDLSNFNAMMELNNGDSVATMAYISTKENRLPYLIISALTFIFILALFVAIMSAS